MAFGGMILTNKGREALTRAQLGGQLNFTGVAVGDGSYGGSFNDIKSLSHQLAVLDVLRADTKDNVCTVEADLSNAGLTEGYYLREIGILAECGDGEVLYTYANAGADAEYIPAGDGAVSVEKRLRFSLITEGVEDITFAPSSVLYLAQQDFEEAMQGIQEQLDGKAEKSEVEALGEAAFSGSYNDLSDKPVIPVAVRVKGDKESAYRTGDINLTPDNIGAAPIRNPVFTGSFSQNRKSGTNVASCSHAEGSNTEASGYNSHAEGLNTIASNDSSHAEGRTTTASGYNSHAEGNSTMASGDYSHAEGRNTVASKACAHAEGVSTVASGGDSHAEGQNTTASGNYAHAEGVGVEASGNASHAEGFFTKAVGANSHAEGSNTEASGNNSHAGGYYTTAYLGQYVQGHYNSTSTTGSISGTSGTALIIGNGDSSSKRSNAFRVTYEGAVIGKQAYSTTGADYAEFFEWEDGNRDNEDRVGIFVTMEGEKIKKAVFGDYILGIVSGSPAVIGNFDECWRGQYLMDEFGRFIYESSEVEDEDGNKCICVGYKQNPDYDPKQTYVPRAERKEWSVVGMVGVLSVRDDGTSQVNGFCNVNDQGEATASENGYRVIGRVTDNIIKVVFR